MKRGNTPQNGERLAQLEGSFMQKLWTWRKDLVDCVRTIDVATTAQDCINKAAEAGLLPPTSLKGSGEKSKPAPAPKSANKSFVQSMDEVLSISSVLLNEQLNKEAAAQTVTQNSDDDAKADGNKMSKFLEFYKSHRQRSLKSRMEKLKSMQEDAGAILLGQTTPAPAVPASNLSPFPSSSVASTLPYPTFNPEAKEKFSELVHKCMHEIEQMENDVLRRNTDYESIMSKLREMAIVDNPRVKRAKQEGGFDSLPANEDGEKEREEQGGEIGEDRSSMETEEAPAANGIYVGKGERGLPSLVEFCLRKCIELAQYLPPLEGSLSEDLLQPLLLGILREEKLAMYPYLLRNLLDSSLSSLSFVNCPYINDRSCEWIAERCGALKKLNLSYCKGITKGTSVAEIIKACPFLETLDLQGCSAVSDETVFEVSMHMGNRLRSINLGGLPVTDEALGGLLLRCPNISELRLRGCARISDSSMCYLEHVAGLTALDISGCEGVTDATLCTIGKCCKYLREFRANEQGSKRITDKGVCYMAAGCTDLRVVELMGCNGVSDAAFEFVLRTCTNLEELAFPSCSGVTKGTGGETMERKSLMEDEGETSVRENLTALNLSGCLNTEDALLEMIASTCPKLKLLDLSSCENVTDEGLVKIGRSCGATLTSLSLSRCLKISDACLLAFVSSANLTSLNLERCGLLTDAAVSRVLGGCPGLTDVDFSLCDGIGDETLLSLSKSCRNVQRLVLRDLPQLTERGVEAIGGLGDLRELRLTYNTQGVNDESIGRVMSNCREMTVLDLSYCTNISRLDVFFQRLSHSFPFLEELYLRGWSQWKTETFVGGGRKLKLLDISWSTNVEDDVLSQVSMETCPSLASLDVAYCTGISGVAIHNLVKRCLGLQAGDEMNGTNSSSVEAKESRLRNVNLRGCGKISFITLRYLTALGLVVLR